jgi:5-methylcytosine-specific restriction endonuclease McrA
VRPGQKATNEEIIAAYRETGSVWRAAERLGMGGQSVHERLVALRYPLASRKWDEDEIKQLRLLVQHMPLSEIARRLGRPYAGVAGKVSELGIGSNFGNRGAKKIPRGQGYDKQSLRRYAKEIDTARLTVHAYARHHKLGVESLCRAFETRLPEWWAAYREAHPGLPVKECEYCRQEFIPSNVRQRFCSRKCGADRRSDLSYFGGRRKHTIGLAEGICQLCGRQDHVGLSSHHILGKENDPENDYLIALCRGCHKIVTLVSARTFVDSPAKWEALISLCLMRSKGKPGAYYTCVEIEFTDDLDEWELDAEDGAA